MDPLSDLMRAVRLTGGVFLEARFTAPWCISANMDASDCRPFLANPTQLVAYHYVIAGAMTVAIPGEPSIEVAAGEAVLFPRNDPHLLASGPGLAPVRAGTLIRPGAAGGPVRIDHGGGGAETRMVCGFLASEEGCNPLIASLPGMLKLDLRQSASRDWVEASVRFAAAELAEGRLASSEMLSRLSELLLVESVRRYAAQLGEAEAGWLRGLKDRQIGRALALIHRDLRAPWTAETLARDVALSRSAFMQRFRDLVGEPPIRYLTRWRLRAARMRLGDPALSVASVAHAVGYESEEAFSRAFKREFGRSPARWRAERA